MKQEVELGISNTSEDEKMNTLCGTKTQKQSAYKTTEGREGGRRKGEMVEGDETV